jgi:hypothetical protein
VCSALCISTTNFITSIGCQSSVWLLASDNVVFIFGYRNLRNPITALSVVCDDQYQEAPLGFTNIERTVFGRSADLSLGNGAQRMFLCHIRGTGPPINNLVLLFNSRKEVPPPGYHKLMKTANDDTADLSSLCKTGNEV